METKKETVLLPCHCGDPHPIEAKIKPGCFIIACQSCPTHVTGCSAEAARKSWNAEVQR